MLVKDPGDSANCPGERPNLNERFDMPDTNPEQWLPVVEYEGFYEISDHGNVRSLDRITTGPSGVQRFRLGKPMKINLKPGHYPMVQLCKNGKVRGHSVHRLVAKSFLGIPANADQLHVCHIDGDKQNPYVSNLKWGTVVDNFRDMKRHGRDRITTYRPPQMLVCQRGHTMTPENTYSYQEGNSLKRRCRACARIRQGKRKAIVALPQPTDMPS